MRQPIKKNIKKKVKDKVAAIRPKETNRKTYQYGTSKLELYFAENFLDKYGIKYIYEYEARDIKRFYDFAVVRQKENYITENKHGLDSVIPRIQHCPIEFLIEVDGGYW